MAAVLTVCSLQAGCSKEEPREQWEQIDKLFASIAEPASNLATCMYTNVKAEVLYKVGYLQSKESAAFEERNQVRLTYSSDPLKEYGDESSKLIVAASEALASHCGAEASEWNAREPGVNFTHPVNLLTDKGIRLIMYGSAFSSFVKHISGSSAHAEGKKAAKMERASALALIELDLKRDEAAKATRLKEQYVSPSPAITK